MNFPVWAIVLSAGTMTFAAAARLAILSVLSRGQCTLSGR
jgi:hypothetical protein